MVARQIRLLTVSYPDDAGLDTALSRAILMRGSEGELGETFRLHVPGRVVAFGKQDVITAGYGRAVDIARSRGYAAVERLAGGRAAVFHEGTLAFSWMIPEHDPTTGLHARFELLAALMTRAFERLGIESRIGELPGEYCPGAYSVAVVSPRPRKVMGVGQRLARRAAHIGGVVVVYGSAATREILVPVYEALGLPWDPATAGSLADVDPTITLAATADAIVAELRELGEVSTTDPDRHTIDLARTIAPDHLSPDDGDRRPPSGRH